MRVEDKYTDVLQNIEFAIVVTHRQYPEMSDYDVMRMLEALKDIYVAEKIGRAPRSFSLSRVEQTLMGKVHHMCEWRLGRARAPGASDEEKNPMPEPKTVDEILLCLKRIQKSVKRWSKHGGRQAYLNFVVQYVQ